MERNSINTNFKSNNDTELIDNSNKAINALKNNNLFVLPVGKLDHMQALTTALYEARIKAINNGTAEINAKNKVREELLFEMSDVGKIVNQQAKGDLDILKTSGFPLKKEAESYPEFPAPDIIKLSPGITHGEVVVEVPVNKNTRMYCIYHAPMPAPANIQEWTSVLSTKHKATVKGITPGTQLAIRAGYIGTSGKINISETFTIFVQ